MKILDFICELFSLRKSAAIITRNEVLEEVENEIKKDSAGATLLMSRSMKFSNDIIKGYLLATSDTLIIIEGLKK